MLVLLLLNLLLLLLVSDRALLCDIVVLVNDGILIRLKHVVIVQIVGAASSTGRLFNASQGQLSLDEIAHLMVKCGREDVWSVIGMRFFCLLLQRSVNCGICLLLLLFDSLKIGAELIWDLRVHANVQVPTMKSGWSMSGLMDEFGVVVLT